MYQTEFNGQHHELGTSGFLYRSNKLMYDRDTESLWSTLAGEPVVGPLVGQGIQLERGQVVTMTWGQWKSRHPDTSVLSLDTGHRRDYGEGVAYQSYFANDRLMFPVPRLDPRLSNKEEVIGLRNGSDAVAISAKFLRQHPVWHVNVGQQKLVVITTPDGANRVYFSEEIRFEEAMPEKNLRDASGQSWELKEDALVWGERKLLRAPAHRVFWFGWHAQFPHTRLIH